MTKQIKKLSCEMCGSNDLEFKIFVDEFGEPTSDIQEQISQSQSYDYYDEGINREAWCNTCEMWQGVINNG